MSTNKGGGFTNKQMHQTFFFFLTFHSLPFPIWIIQRVDASLFGLNWTSYIWVHFELPLSDHLFWNLEKRASKVWKTAMAINIKGNSTIKDLIVKNIFNSNKIQKCMGQHSRKIKDIRISRTQPRGGISWVLRQPKDSQVHSNSSGQVKWTLRTFLSGHLENPNSRKLIDSQNRPT